MRALLAFSARDDVRALVGQLTEDETVQGVVLDYDPLWLKLSHLRSRVGEEGLLRYVDQLYDSLHYRRLSGLCLPFDYDEFEPTTSEPAPPDPSWRPPGWSEIQYLRGHKDSTGDADPFVVKVCLFPGRGERRTPEVGGRTLKVVFEHRAPAELMMPLRQYRPVIGGVSIGHGARKSATLGGVVRDDDDVRWGVTCSHGVAANTPLDQPAQCDRGNVSARLGIPHYLSSLVPSPQGRPCNPYNRASVLNTVDAALIKFDDAISSDLEVLNVGGLDGITFKSDLDPGSLIELAGKTSPSRMLEVGGLALTYKLRNRSTNATYCFHHTFELRWPHMWRLATGRPVRPGDSGAWTITAGPSGPEWSGMVIGGDRMVGYAQFAEDVVEWAKANHSLQLHVL